MVALINCNAGKVHVKPVDPAGHPGSDIFYPRLIIIDLADHADFGLYEFTLHRGSLNLHKL